MPEDKLSLDEYIPCTGGCNIVAPCRNHLAFRTLPKPVKAAINAYMYQEFMELATEIVNEHKVIGQKLSVVGVELFEHTIKAKASALYQEGDNDG